MVQIIQKNEKTSEKENRIFFFGIETVFPVLDNFGGNCYDRDVADDG